MVTNLWARCGAPVLGYLLSFVLGLAVVGLTSGCSLIDRGPTVALLLASDSTYRWANVDQPSFEAKLQLECPECNVVTFDAERDVEEQARQFAEVVADENLAAIVLNAVDSKAAQELVNSTKIPVIAYDRFIRDADYYVSYAPEATGIKLAQHVLGEVGDVGGVVVINGAASDRNSVAIAAGVDRILSRTKLKVLAEFDPKSWEGEEVKGWLTGTLKKVKIAEIDAIIASSDDQAAGVVEALQEAGVSQREWPVITGQDADLSAVQRLLMGQQSVTVYKSFRAEAEHAAVVATGYVNGKEPAEERAVDGVPGRVFRPQPVTLQSVTNVLVRDGFYQLDEICVDEYLTRCQELGMV
jgi:D-xylose transport system substrate-binding protein